MNSLDLLTRHRPTQRVDESAWERAIESMGTTLLAHTEIEIASQRWRMLEVEFYVCADGFRDPYAHAHEEQFATGRWYFHRASATSYRGGSFKGVDLTLGTENTSIGVLIRACQNVDTHEVLEGPSLWVDHLLRAGGARSIEQWVQAHGIVVQSHPIARVRACENTAMQPIVRAPRVGLRMNDETRTEHHRFAARLHRFVGDPRLVRKGNALVVAALHASAMDAREIAERTNTRVETVRAYVRGFERGRAVGWKDCAPDSCTRASLMQRLGAVWNASQVATRAC